MNLRHLESFLAVADELHFGRAAQKLHLSQASVSEAVSALEESLGAPLFQRTTRKVRLTPFGEWFLGQVRTPYNQLRAAHDAARAGNHGRDQLVVGHTPELGHLVFPGLVARLAGAGEPPPRWNPRLMHTHEQMAAVANGSIDLGLCWQPTVDPPLRATVLARCPFAAVLRADDPLQELPTLALRDLRGRRILITPGADNQFIQSRLESAFAGAGLTLKNVDEVARYDELAVNVVSQGTVGLHPAAIVLVNRVPGLRFREVREPGLELDISVIRRTEARPAEDAFVRFLQAESLEVMAAVVHELETANAVAVE